MLKSLGGELEFICCTVCFNNDTYSLSFIAVKIAAKIKFYIVFSNFLS